MRPSAVRRLRGWDSGPSSKATSFLFYSHGKVSRVSDEGREFDATRDLDCCDLIDFYSHGKVPRVMDKAKILPCTHRGLPVTLTCLVIEGATVTDDD
ncbi:hypothetical protein OPV22_023169 [Ensete ventricosum]|uniref:Uncharacterized protein n=1 Tax=Ensete ventricosum TaxID=4639 RepID=A0AAV8QL68_ENSVE|nr:hypothetical protein OPV22_023169 [Ensete ventricosum]